MQSITSVSAPPQSAATIAGTHGLVSRLISTLTNIKANAPGLEMAFLLSNDEKQDPVQIVDLSIGPDIHQTYRIGSRFISSEGSFGTSLSPLIENATPYEKGHNEFELDETLYNLRKNIERIRPGTFGSLNT